MLNNFFFSSAKTPCPKKITDKNLDLIIANDITRKDSGFSSETNKVWMINKNKETIELPTLTKFEVANKILDQIKPLLD